MRAADRNGLPPYGPEPFFWSGALGGVAGRGLDPWLSAGAALRWYLLAHPGEPSAALVHSHGVQVLAFAAQRGATFGPVVDISGPVRADMSGAYAALARGCRSWTHVYDTTDPILLEGEVGDGSFFRRVENPHATENLDVTGRGYQHSGLFDDIPAWVELGLWARLAGVTGSEKAS